MVTGETLREPTWQERIPIEILETGIFIQGQYVREALRRMALYPDTSKALAIAVDTLNWQSNAMAAGERERGALQKVISNREARLQVEIEIGKKDAIRSRAEGLLVGALAGALGVGGFAVGMQATGGDWRWGIAGLGLGVGISAGVALVICIPRIGVKK